MLVLWQERGSLRSSMYFVHFIWWGYQTPRRVPWPIALALAGQVRSLRCKKPEVLVRKKSTRTQFYCALARVARTSELWSMDLPGSVGIRKALKAQPRCASPQVGGHHRGSPRSLLHCRQSRTRGWGWLPGAQLGFGVLLAFKNGETAHPRARFLSTSLNPKP